MVKSEFRGGKFYGAVLALELISKKNIHASKFDVERDFMVLKKAKNFGEAVSGGNGPYEFVVVFVDNFRSIGQKEYHGLLPVNYLYGKIVAVQKQRSHSINCSIILKRGSKSKIF